MHVVEEEQMEEHTFLGEPVSIFMSVKKMVIHQQVEAWFWSGGISSEESLDKFLGSGGVPSIESHGDYIT